MSYGSHRIDSWKAHGCSNGASLAEQGAAGTLPEGRVWAAINSALKAIVRQLPWTPSACIKGLFISDMLCAALSVFAGYSWSPSYSLSTATSHVNVELVIVAFSGSFAFSGLAAGVYDRRYLHTAWQSLLAVATAALMAWGIVLALNYVFFYRYVGRWIVLISTAALIPAAFGPRFLLFLSARISNNILVVGRATTASLIETAALKIGSLDPKVSVVLPEHLSAIRDRRPDLDPKLRALCEDGNFCLIMVEDECDREVLGHALEHLKEGRQVAGFLWYFENTFQKAPVEKMDPSWLMSAHLDLIQPLGRTIKRFCDLALAGLGLLLCLPVWPLIGLLIKMSSPGPVLYYQHRVGIYGKPFSLIKFRSMIDGAEADGKPLWASRRDRRVTWIGRILRKTRLDETPQFINVLKGDMSLVGPRPERPEFVALLSSAIPYYGLRHLVKPGLTGWAQIMHGYGASKEDALEKLRYDLYYIKHGNLMLDFTIIIRTIGAVMRGAR
jgi:exopolysaccharide biosynthesis polyprenyl glycosylphosphotransferase